MSIVFVCPPGFFCIICLLRSRPSAEVPAPAVDADMASTGGSMRPPLLVMPSHYFEEKPQDDLPVMTSKLGLKLKVDECGLRMSKCVRVEQ